MADKALTATEVLLEVKQRTEVPQYMVDRQHTMLERHQCTSHRLQQQIASEMQVGAQVVTQVTRQMISTKQAVNSEILEVVLHGEMMSLKRAASDSGEKEAKRQELKRNNRLRGDKYTL